MQYRTNNAMVQTFGVNSLNELTTVARTNTLTVAGATSGAATNVTVNGSAATRYGDNAWALAGVSLSDGTNTFTAVAQDSSGRADTNSVSAYLPASASYQYDDNGNLTSDGRRGFYYDGENRLRTITVTNSWKSEFQYDAQHRRRIRKEYTWQNSAWVKTEEVRYIYDGLLVIQERDANSLPRVTYTRGLDLSGSLPDGPTGAGGIGGLLARSTLNSQPSTHSYYHADGNGNITCLINEKQAVVARYAYDPYGSTLGKSGPLAEENLYRFSSKEAHAQSGLVCYLYRYYEPALQLWLSRDPAGQRSSANTYSYVLNEPVSLVDPFGLYAFRTIIAFGDFWTPVPGWRNVIGYGFGEFYVVPAAVRQRSWPSLRFPGQVECVRYHSLTAYFRAYIPRIGRVDPAPRGDEFLVTQSGQTASLRHEMRHRDIDAHYATLYSIFEYKLNRVVGVGEDESECYRNVDAQQSTVFGRFNFLMDRYEPYWENDQRVVDFNEQAHVTEQQSTDGQWVYYFDGAYFRYGGPPYRMSPRRPRKAIIDWDRPVKEFWPEDDWWWPYAPNPVPTS